MRILHPWVRRNIQRKALIFVVLTLTVSGLVFWRHEEAVAPITSNNQTSTDSSTTSNGSGQSQVFNKQQYSNSDPASLWVVVNKGRILPSLYAPSVVVPKVTNHYGNGSNDSHLRPEATSAIEKMFAVARTDNLSLVLYSGYRSYPEQVTTYNGFVARDGAAKADTYSARPGHSEHQTGLAADISATSGKCDLSQCFADTPEGKWLAANAYKYGFILRYTKDAQSLTGFVSEPWHFRFVGKDLAAQIHQTSQTLEQFFGLPTYPDYPTNSIQLQAGS